MVKSIFDLEKRTDIKKECLKIEKYLNKDIFFELKYDLEVSFWEMIDSFIEYWPYRYTATNIQDFFDLYELPWNVKDMNEEQCLYYLQLIFDIIMWIDKHRQSFYYNSIEFDLCELNQKNDNCFRTVIKNIVLMIELLNYKAIKIDEHYTFIKRDADVDSVLNILETEDDLRLSLLEYNDFRIENNKEEKKIILKKIGDYLEPRRKELSKFNKSLTDDVFFVLNKFYIRHNNENNIKLETDEEYILCYDNLFKMMIQLIRTPKIVEIQSKLKEYKK